MLFTHKHAVIAESLLGQALHYLDGQWPKLTRYVDDDSYPIDKAMVSYCTSYRFWSGVVFPALIE